MPHPSWVVVVNIVHSIVQGNEGWKSKVKISTVTGMIHDTIIRCTSI